MSDRRTPEKSLRPDLAAVAVHLRTRGPLLGYWHVFDQLIELDIAFPDLSFRDFIRASVVASTEGEG
jgi:hypothetical protein